MLVDDFLAGAARRYPDKVGLVCGEQRFTFREIDESANRLASGLRERGVARGDRVGIYLENSAELVISVFAALRADAVFVPIGATMKADKLAYILRDCRAAALITNQRATTVVNEALERVKCLRALIIVGMSGEYPRPAPKACSFESLVDRVRPAARPERSAIDIDLAALIYTSGTTGCAKGVMLTHLNMVSAAMSIDSYLGNTPEDVILNVLPLSFDYGLYQVFLAFNAGARLILEPAFIYTALMVDLIVRENVTALPVVPMLAVLLLKHDLVPCRASLRYITSTGAALPPAHIATLRAQLPDVRIFSMYGLTECKRVAYLDPDEIDDRPTSVGKPMDNVEVYLADETGTLRSTGVGELVIRGSNVMQGYWGDTEATARVLKPGSVPGQPLLYSGDLFEIDEDGYMYFLARLDDVIKSRGQRVSPKEVENVIYEMPGVIGVSVVGVPDDTVGNWIKAFVCTDPDAPMSEQDILRHCTQRLEDFMVPKVVEFVPSIPTTSSGKLHRRHMAESTRARLRA